MFNEIEQKGGDMAYDYSKLRGRIVEKFGNQKSFAVAMGWSERTMSLKINGLRFWSQPEIEKAMKLLELNGDDIRPYFFTENVQ
jgi:hypothetical protein